MATTRTIRGFTRADAQTLGRLEAGLSALEDGLKALSLNVSQLSSGLWNRVDRIEREKVSHTDLVEHFDRIENKIDEGRTHAGEKHTDHEKRLRVLEQFRWKLVGIASAISGVLSAVVTKLILSYSSGQMK